MSKLTPEQEARYATMAERAEAEDYTPIDKLDELTTGASTSAAELDELLADLDQIEATESTATPTGVTSQERATEKDARQLATLGRPSLSGSKGGGPSPKRQVRLPHELDNALAARAARENRKPSEIIRDALTAYLRAS